MKPGLNGVRRIHLPFALPFPFIFALAAGAGLRLIAMLGYPGALWFAGDSYVYLGAALRPQPNMSKTTGYSVFLHALEPFHSLTLVVGLQHLMGLAVTVMIYLLLRRAGGGLRGVVPFLVGLVHAEPGLGVLPVGPGVLVRRMLRDQAASQRAGDLPDRDAVQPDPAR